MFKQIAIIAVISASPAAAQAEDCTGVTEMIDALRQGFGEEILLIAADTERNSSLTFFTNPETRSWTTVRTTPEGRACIEAFGPDWTTPAEYQSATGASH